MSIINWYKIGREFAYYGRGRVSGSALSVADQLEFDSGYCDELEANA